MEATAKAHTNIALIKYWGKRDEALILPTNNSLSLTLDGFFTTTRVAFKEDLTEDVFYLNDNAETGTALQRVQKFLDLVRRLAGKHIYAKVESTNAVPTAAGFASSASGFAALSAAASKAIGLDLTDQELSRLTRQGSGSACRSIYGGFVEWQQGSKQDGSDSYAVQIAPKDYWDVRVAAVVLSDKSKTVSSREGMTRTVSTSPFFDAWVKSIPADLANIKDAIAAKDFEAVGEIAEANCMRMHATTLSAKPPFMYWQDATVSVMQVVQAMRKEGIAAYFTIDAGPNLKILYLPDDEAAILQKLRDIPGVQSVIASKPGQGITYL
ncbi:diphosphomevalonate decarboxylase [Virgibacillus sp. 179-BFC.A HS]|uniref:diphosphomevalonate decarboxylase n=1 Tax=Tigheibacillus jepli TaxID=3035914 RepID=A0ABU5CL94_9BACI|nr:diphosphomevalonate decarboxylase [Virgibacillus sp. 179-BFC.A HS]MDY0407136.1 diphosphomevalonate decarboxylase [Virgibacillus sp. 179-BFC.A HS]